MNIPFENLEMISKIYTLLLTIKEEKEMSQQKRWLSSEELFEYQPYKESSIKKLIKEKELLEGKHFYQKKRIKIYDRLAIDNYIMGRDENQLHNNISANVDVLTDQLIKNIA